MILDWRSAVRCALLCVGGVTAVATLSCRRREPAPVPSIRVGWQTSWATQAQLALVLAKTDILQRHGLKGTFHSFSYGGPLAEAAMAGQIDVLFAADQPAINLIARGAKWKIVSRCIDFRDAILVPPSSPIREVSGLRGKRIAVPFGSGAHRVVIELLTGAGLAAERDVTLVNLDIAEVNATIQAGAKADANGLWRGDISAAANWDPNIAEFENKGLVRVLVEKKLFGVTAMSAPFIAASSDGAAAFVRALREALFYYGQNSERADTWYREEVKINFEPGVLQKSASFDRNLKARSIELIDLRLQPAEIEVLQASADFALGAGIIKAGLRAFAARQN